MKFALGLAFSLMLAGNAVAAEEWLPVMKAGGAVVEMGAGSWGHDNNASTGVFKFSSQDGETYTVGKIADKSCDKGRGTIFLTSLTGDKPAQLDYSSSKKDVGGYVGTALCGAYQYLKKRGEL